MTFYKALKSLNPQWFQTFAIGSLLFIGGKYFGFINIDWLEILGVLILTVSFDYGLNKLEGKKTGFPYSAINTAIGICLFLRTDQLLIYLFTGVVAILTKHLIQIEGKHFYNPSYTAIFLSLIIFPEIAYVNHTQWGNDWLVLGSIVLLGSLVMWRVGFLDAVITFFASFFLWLNLFTTYNFGDLLLLYLTGSFFILVFHGFTDPATIPQKRLNRVLYVLQISMMFFVCRLFINESYSFFAAYFIVQSLELIWWTQRSKNIKGLAAQTFYQGVSSIIIFIILAGLSFNYYFSHDLLMPEIQTNRCLQIICDWNPDI